MFKCGHNIHQNCLKKDDVSCVKCFNEYDNIQKIIQSRNNTVRIGVRGRNDSRRGPRPTVDTKNT